MTAPSPSLPYYPRPLFRHSPTYTRWSLLSACAVHTQLHQLPGYAGQDIWHHGNHPIRWVRVVGVLVAHDAFDTRYGMVLDDGSGHTLDVVAWRNRPAAPPPPGIDALAVGCVLRVGGVVSEFRGVRQLEVRKLRVLRDTNQEVRALAARRAFEREVLARPWVVPAEVLEREERRRVQVVVVQGAGGGGGGFRGRRRSPGRDFSVVIPPFRGQRDVPEVPPVLPPTPAPKFFGHRRTSRQPEVPTTTTAEAPPRYIGRKRPPPPEPAPKPRFVGHKRTVPEPSSSPPDKPHKHSASSAEITADPGPSLSFRAHKRIKLRDEAQPRDGERNRPLKPLSSPPQSFAVVVPRPPDDYPRKAALPLPCPPTVPVFLGKRRPAPPPSSPPARKHHRQHPRQRQRTAAPAPAEERPKARFLGRRRVTELSTALLPAGARPCASARELNCVLAGERRKAADPSSSSSRVTRRRAREDAQVPSSSSSSSTSTSTGSSSSSARQTHGARDEPLPTLPPPPPPPPQQAQASTFRGRRRAAAKPKPKPEPTTTPGFIGRRRKPARERDGQLQEDEAEAEALAALAAAASPYVPTPTPTRSGGGELSFEFSDYVPSPAPFVGRRRG